MIQENMNNDVSKTSQLGDTSTFDDTNCHDLSPQDSPSTVEKDMKNWGSINNWADVMWEELEELVDADITGEDLMKSFGFKRRKELEIVFYQLSLRKGKLFTIYWLADKEANEHSLPDLKSSKDGLRISNIRFQRYGFDVSRNTYFEMKKISDTEVLLIIIKNNK